jgi:hypothetical protein
MRADKNSKFVSEVGNLSTSVGNSISGADLLESAPILVRVPCKFAPSREFKFPC